MSGRGARPGTERVGHPAEDAAAADVDLTDEDLRLLDEAAPGAATAGDRCPDRSTVRLGTTAGKAPRRAREDGDVQVLSSAADRP